MPAVSHYYDDDKTVCPSVCLPLDCVFFCYYVPPSFSIHFDLQAANHTACCMMEE
jgi:hypothetical protein